MTTSPFGKYAGIVAAAAAALILGAWIASLVGLVAASETLNSVALLVVGVVFGTGAGAAVVANGAHKQAEAANVRLDAVQAPPAQVATAIVHERVVHATEVLEARADTTDAVG